MRISNSHGSGRAHFARSSYTRMICPRLPSAPPPHRPASSKPKGSWRRVRRGCSHGRRRRASSPSMRPYSTFEKFHVSSGDMIGLNSGSLPSRCVALICSATRRTDKTCDPRSVFVSAFRRAVSTRALNATLGTDARQRQRSARSPVRPRSLRDGGLEIASPGDAFSSETDGRAAPAWPAWLRRPRARNRAPASRLRSSPRRTAGRASPDRRRRRRAATVARPRPPTSRRRAHP